jgi:hypothetical protein
LVEIPGMEGRGRKTGGRKGRRMGGYKGMVKEK